MRVHIAKHLKNRVQAIRTAINKLNTAARALSPPRETLTAAEVLSKTFVGELDLLKDARDDIRSRPWSIPALRTFMDNYFRLTHAKEELTRLNVEMRRLRTWIRDDELSTKNCINILQVQDPDLAFVLQGRLSLKMQVNDRIIKQLDAVERFRGFTGVRGCGVGRYTMPDAPAFPTRSPLHQAPFVEAGAAATIPLGDEAPEVVQDGQDSDASDDEVEREAALEHLDSAMDRLAA